MADYSLPANVVAERCVLGSMMLSEEAAAVALGALTEEDFSDREPKNKLVFHAMYELNVSGRPIDVNTVFDELISLKYDKEVPNEYLMELLNGVLTPDNVDDYINMVHEQAVLRDFLLAMRKVEGEYSKGVPDIGDFIVKANDQIAQIAQRRSVKGMRSAGEIARAVGAKIQQSNESDQRGLTGVDTGFRQINEITHGWQKGDLIILAARPSVGKTALSLNFAFNAAAKSKCTVAFFSLEMSSEKIMERLISSRSSVPNDHIMTGFANKDEKVKIGAAINELDKTSIFFDDSPDSKLGDIISKATKLKAQHPDLGLILIDYLGRIRMSDRPSLDNRQQEVSVISGALKQLARSLNVPVICLSQLNRSVEDNDDKKPMLSNLRESGSVEQDADIVMLLYRPSYYEDLGISLNKKKKFGKEEEQQPQENTQKKPSDVCEVTVSIAKNRNGRVGEAKLVFQKSFSRFSDPSRDFEDRQAQIEAQRYSNN